MVNLKNRLKKDLCIIWWRFQRIIIQNSHFIKPNSCKQHQFKVILHQSKVTPTTLITNLKVKSSPTYSKISVHCKKKTKTAHWHQMLYPQDPINKYLQAKAIRVRSIQSQTILNNKRCSKLFYFGWKQSQVFRNPLKMG